jgi:hypothetical protein
MEFVKVRPQLRQINNIVVAPPTVCGLPGYSGHSGILPADRSLEHAQCSALPLVVVLVAMIVLCPWMRGLPVVLSTESGQLVRGQLGLLLVDRTQGVVPSHVLLPAVVTVMHMSPPYRMMHERYAVLTLQVG